MSLQGRWFQLAMGLGLVVLGLVFAGVLLSFWDWSFDGTSTPPALLSFWLLAMALACAGYGVRYLLRAATG